MTRRQKLALGATVIIGGTVAAAILASLSSTDPFATLEQHVSRQRTIYFTDSINVKCQARVLLVKGLTLDQIADCTGVDIRMAGYKFDAVDSSDSQYEYYAPHPSNPDLESAIFVTKDPRYPDAVVVSESRPATWTDILVARLTSASLHPFSTRPSDFEPLF